MALRYGEDSFLYYWDRIMKKYFVLLPDFKEWSMLALSLHGYAVGILVGNFIVLCLFLFLGEAVRFNKY